MRALKVDKPFIVIVALLIIVGFIILLSAGMGLLTREGARFSSIVLSQVAGLILGLALMCATAMIPLKIWRTYSLYVFAFSILATLLVFVPHLGFAHGGARRWIYLFGFTLQTSEFLKLGFILYCAAWLSSIKDRVQTFRYGALPLMVLLALIGILLLVQPDTDTFVVMILTAVGMFIVAGGKYRHIALLGLIAGIVFTGVLLSRPYIKARVLTFLNPATDSLGSGYQIQQSLIAVGSGGFAGRGFGQSIQKFSYLPEPIGDSIFAVAAEEFGFIGSTLLILLYVAFALRSMKIAGTTNDLFSRLLIVGIVILIVTQSFMNIAAMLSLIPLTGIALLFVSHGGSALLFTLAGTGLIIAVSRQKKST